MRRFLDLTPFFAIGLAVLAARLAPRAGRLGAGALIAWNLVLVANFTYVIRVDRDPGFGGLLAHGWGALDKQALKVAGADEGGLLAVD